MLLVGGRKVPHDPTSIAIALALLGFANTGIGWVILRAVRRYDSVLKRVEKLEGRCHKLDGKFSKLEGLFGISIRVDN